MRHLALLIIIVMIGAETLAQAGLNKLQQYENSSQQTILFEAVPQLKMAKFEKMQTFLKPKLMSVSDLVFSNDTTWSYDEIRRDGEKVFVPEFYSQGYYKGNQTNFSTFNQSMTWNGASAEWQLDYTQERWFNDSFNDSSKSYYFYNGSPIPTSGDKYIYTKNPPEGFGSEEYYFQLGNDGNWEPISITQMGEMYSIDNYLYRMFTFSETLGDYYLSLVMSGALTDSSVISENKQLNEDGITYQSSFYKKLDKQGKAIYSVFYWYDMETKKLVPTDSTHFYYAGNTQTSVTFEKDWNDEWVIQTFSRTYQSPAIFSDSGLKADSIIGYNASYDTEADSVILGEILSKHYFQYNEEGDLTEHITYFRYAEDLVITYKMETDNFVEGEYNITRETSYNRDYTIEQLVRTSVSEIGENTYGNKSINRYFNFAFNGDTLIGSKDLMFTEEGGLVMYSMSYFWDKNISDFVLYNVSVYTEKIPIATTSIITEDGDDRRGIYATSALPGALTDGPLFIEMGDTLDFIISARNPDMSIPKVEVTNFPQTATYYPETRRFYWIVDDLNPEPMTYTAIRGTQSTQTVVKFAYGEIATPLERENSMPKQVQLNQNYPNPFNPSTNITYSIGSAGIVQLKVYNVMGQLVGTLVNELKQVGRHDVQWNAIDGASGVYYYRLEANNTVITKKMTLIK